MLMPYVPVFGFERASLIDYPGEVAMVIFTCGCNFKCEYCHNRKSMGMESEMPLNHYDKMLNEIVRSDCSAIVITGGEPTIWGDGLVHLCKWIRTYSPNKKIKIDTNGSKPEIIKKLISDQCVDFIAMDIKSTRDNYNLFSDAKYVVDCMVCHSVLSRQKDWLDENKKPVAFELRHTKYINESNEILAKIIDLYPGIKIQERRDINEKRKEA